MARSRYTHPIRESRMNGPHDADGDNLWNRPRRRKEVQRGVAYAARCIAARKGSR